MHYSVKRVGLTMQASQNPNISLDFYAMHSGLVKTQLIEKKLPLSKNAQI